MHLTKPTAILFDWDNTLVDTWPLIHTALNMTLRFMEHPEWSFEKVRSEVKKSMRDSFPGLFGDRWEDAAKHYQTSYRSIHLQSLQPLAGAEEMLAAIPRDQVFVGIVSNKKGGTLREELKYLGWEHYFDAAIGAGDADHDKPHPAPVLLALKDCDVVPGPHAWFVGDTGVDLECAQATGCTPVLYAHQKAEGSQFEGFPFAAQVVSQAEMKALILAACNA